MADTDLTNAVVWDTETFPNVTTVQAECLHSDHSAIFEFSPYRDDRYGLFEWLDHLRVNRIPMIGFYSLTYDYPLLHWWMKNKGASTEQIYARAQEIITASNFEDIRRFNETIWERERVIPQIDMFKVCHFDNKAKRTSLKALEINMRMDNVIEMPVRYGTVLTEDEINIKLRPYGGHDTHATKRFAQYNMSALEFRIGMEKQIHGDVMNFSDVKIGVKLLEERIGEDICYEPAHYEQDALTGQQNYVRKKPRQTIRSTIDLNEVIFPYIRFDNPEFNRVHQWLKGQTLRPDDLADADSIEAKVAQTKGVFKGVNANVGGVQFDFGTGGIHASIRPQRVYSTETDIIKDVDVKGYYPAAAIINNLAPAHLGAAFSAVYSKLPDEREVWKKKKGAKCVEANSLKLGGNGVYGQSNNPFSVFYDPQFTMSVTINCQLLICMLAEWLCSVPSVRIIQANTDGITYYCARSDEELCDKIGKGWQEYTCLELETQTYASMFIRDVNNYVATDLKGKMKLKGAYWTPDIGENYYKSIAECQPPAWHKDLGNCVSIRAAVYEMQCGIPGSAEWYIRSCFDPHDFCLRQKVTKQYTLKIGNDLTQNTTRYYVSTAGAPMTKTSPEKGTLGAFKKANGISDYEYNRVMAETRGAWDARVCTKNKSKYAPSISNIESGYKVKDANNIANFNFADVDYAYYINETRKLII